MPKGRVTIERIIAIANCAPFILRKDLDNVADDAFVLDDFRLEDFLGGLTIGLIDDVVRPVNDVSLLWSNRVEPTQYTIDLLSDGFHAAAGCIVSTIGTRSFFSALLNPRGERLIGDAVCAQRITSCHVLK